MVVHQTHFYFEGSKSWGKNSEPVLIRSSPQGVVPLVVSNPLYLLQYMYLPYLLLHNIQDLSL